MDRSMLTEEEKAEIWRRYQGGASLRSIHQALGRAGQTVWLFVASTGGLPPVARTRSALHLSMAEREEISRGMVAQKSCRAIARCLERSSSTVSREIAGRTIVERSSRFVILICLPRGRGSEQVLTALARRIVTLPRQL